MLISREVCIWDPEPLQSSLQGLYTPNLRSLVFIILPWAPPSKVSPFSIKFNTKGRTLRWQSLWSVGFLFHLGWLLWECESIGVEATCQGPWRETEREPTHPAEDAEALCIQIWMAPLYSHSVYKVIPSGWHICYCPYGWWCICIRWALVFN